MVKSKEEPPAWLLQLVMRDVDQSDAKFERMSGFPSEEVTPETAVDQPAVQSTRPSASSSDRRSAHPFTHSSSAASASEQQSSYNHPSSVDHSLPAARAATGSHTNNKNPLNDSQISRQQHDNTGRFESARNFPEDFGMTRTESYPTPRVQSSTLTSLPRTTTTTNATPGSSGTTSRAQVRTSEIAMTAETTAVPTRNPVYFVMKQSDLPKDLILTGAQIEAVETLTIFRARVRLNSTDSFRGSSNSTRNQVLSSACT